MNSCSACASLSNLPPLAEGYLRKFAAVHRLMERCEGFALIPIELDSPSDGIALVEWLEREGLRVRAVTPSTVESWRHLVSLLFKSNTDAVDALAIIADLGPGCDDALESLEAQCHAVQFGLMRPLLWCGKRSFLCRTWEHAPRLWAAAKLALPMTLHPKLSCLPQLHADHAMLLLEHLHRALENEQQRGEIQAVVDLTLILLREYVHQGRGLDGFAFATSILRWLDERILIYPEIRSSVVQQRPLLEQAAQTVLHVESEILDFAFELVQPESHPGPISAQRRTVTIPPPKSALTPQPATATQPQSLDCLLAEVHDSMQSCTCCEGSGECLTCDGSGTWHADGLEEDVCSACGGSGRCPDC
jgi:hypothetical protein